MPFWMDRSSLVCQTKTPKPLSLSLIHISWFLSILDLSDLMIYEESLILKLPYGKTDLKLCMCKQIHEVMAYMWMHPKITILLKRTEWRLCYVPQKKIFFGTPCIRDMWGCSAALIYQPTIALSIDFSSWLRQNIIFHHFFNFKLTHTLCLYKTMLKRGLFGCDLKQQVTVIALTYCVS